MPNTTVRKVTVAPKTTPVAEDIDSKPAVAEEVFDENTLPYIVRLSPPWTTYWNELKGLFVNDSQVEVNDMIKVAGGYSIVIGVQDNAKYEALKQILPSDIQFGNVNVTLDIRPTDGVVGAPEVVPSTKEVLDYYKTAFKDTGRVVDTQIVKTPTGDEIGYVIVEAGIYQFFNDDLTTLYGWKTMTIENMFKEVFVTRANTPVIYFSSEILR